MTKSEREAREKTLQEIRELAFFDTAKAAKARAELSAGVCRPGVVDEWLQVIWYSDECGGKIVRFKAGNPHARKRERISAEAVGEAEENREAERLANSLSRTRRRIFEIAACNSWDWFFTGTLDGEKCDRDDLNGTFKRLSQFLRDYRKKQDGERVTYFIVPEQHKNGAWHFHGLIHGLSEAELYKFRVSDKIPARIKKTIREGMSVYTWREYEKRFGWATFTSVRSQNAVSKYVTKYITKDMQAANADSNRHLYYASQGLKKPQILAEGRVMGELVPYVDYQNDWVGVRSLNEREEAQAIIERYL